MLDEILTPEEVARELKITTRGVKDLLRAGTLNGFKIGRRWRIRRSDFVDFIYPVAIAPLREEDLDEEDKKAIIEAEEDVKAGRLYPLAEVMKEFGISA